MRCAAPASSITSIALSGSWRSLMYLADSSAAACIAASAYFTLWCSSKRRLQALEDLDRLSRTVGSTTSTFWKRRDSAASFSKMPRYSVKVVAPMHLSCPLRAPASAGCEASIAPPEAAPAPIRVWISSMNRIGLGLLLQLP